MQTVVLFFVLAAVAMAWKFAVNFFAFKRLKSLMDDHATYLKGALSNSGASNASGFLEKTPEIKALINRAGIEGSGGAYVEPMGFGKGRTVTYSYLDNIALLDKETQHQVKQYMHLAVGVYRMRMKEAFSPRHWIDQLLHLPSRALGHAGVPPTSPIARVSDLVGWAIALFALVVSLPDFVEARDAVSSWLFAAFEWVRVQLS